MKNPTHTYSEEGWYLATLEVRDSEGRIAEDTQWIHIIKTNDDDNCRKYNPEDYGLKIVGVTYNEVAEKGSQQRIGVSVKNTGIVKEEKVRVAVLLLDDGEFSTIARFEIDPSETKTGVIMLNIPETTWTGWQTLRVVASNDYTKAITHREIKVVE